MVRDSNTFYVVQSDVISTGMYASDSEYLLYRHVNKKGHGIAPFLLSQFMSGSSYASIFYGFVGNSDFE